MIRKIWKLLPTKFRDQSWRFLALNKEMFLRLRGGSALCLVRERPDNLIQIDVFDALRAPRRLSCVVPQDNMFLIAEVFTKRYCVEFFPLIHSHLSRRAYKSPLIIDAGANVGIFSLLAQSTFGHYGTRTLAFEPLPSNLDLLRTNLAPVKSSVDVVTVALGAKPETGRRMIVISATGATINETDAQLYLDSVGRHQNVPETSVDVTTLDLFLKTDKRQVALIKMDVEGSEEAILEGAAETISRDLPAIIYCYEHIVNDRTKTEVFMRTLGPYRSVDHARSKTMLFVPDAL